MAVPEPRFEVLDAANPASNRRWTALWETWPRREVFAHPGYLRLFASPPARACCAVLTTDSSTVLYPFVMRDLAAESYFDAAVGGRYDLTSAYGYSGPYAWGDALTSEQQAEFWRSFDAWARAEQVVAEFIRFSLSPDEQLTLYPGQRLARQPNVVRRLDLDEDALWMDFEHKVRKNVNKAKRSGVVVVQDATGERLSDFLRIYEHTMERRQADEGYYFLADFFSRIHAGLDGQFCYFHALHDGRVVSTELVLVSATRVYSYLGGTDSQAFELRPNDLIKHEIILWAKQQGKQEFVLGGSYQPLDGVFRYKLSLAPTGETPFFVGTRVIARDAYDQLIERRRNAAAGRGETWTPRPDYFPEYRG